MKAEEFIKSKNLNFSRIWKDGNKDVAKLMNEYTKLKIDEIVKMYVPDGNPKVWLDKIIKIKDDL